MVIHPEVLVEEMGSLGDLRKNLYISDKAHLVMPQHIAMERALEEAKGKERIGTTGRGIGLAYAAKDMRINYRIGDLIDKDGDIDKETFWKKLNQDPYFLILEKTFGVKLSREETAEKYFDLAEKFNDRVRDTGHMLQDALERDEHILFEVPREPCLT